MVNGTGDPEYLGWVGRVLRDERKRRAELTGYNLGIRRDTSAQIRARWSAEVTCRLPAEFEGRVVFSFGVNDMACDKDKLFRVPPSESHKFAQAIMTEAASRWPVLWISPVPIGRGGPNHGNRAAWLLEEDYQDKRLAQLVLDYAAIADRLKVPYLDLFTPLSRSRRWRWALAAGGDGIHPSAFGYSRMAKLIESWSAWQAWLK